jgi:hypothetical protein
VGTHGRRQDAMKTEECIGFLCSIEGINKATIQIGIFDSVATFRRDLE